jgi:hypothetical protein
MPLAGGAVWFPDGSFLDRSQHVQPYLLPFFLGPESVWIADDCNQWSGVIVVVVRPQNRRIAGLNCGERATSGGRGGAQFGTALKQIEINGEVEHQNQRPKYKLEIASEARGIKH